LLQGVAGEKKAEVQERISVIPIAVDTAELQPVQRHADSVNILTLGSLHYPPNADGIRWFLEEVFPRIQEQLPEVTLTIIGRNPPADFLQAAANAPNRITVTGYVPDLTPFMEKAALLVVPVRAGGGMRVRLLEAFARAMPAVTTTVGLEGIDARHDQEVLVADDPGSFAAETIRLIKDKELQQHLSGNGRILAETRYDWQVVLTQLDAVYQLAQHASSLL
jgi:glycosyltransferase involved in cell wall biosynthesis